MQRTISTWVSPPAALFIALWLSLMALGPARMFRDPGTFWHTVVGEQILRSGRLPRTDSFSFTHAGQPWIAQQWLGEIVMALMHRLAGLDGLLLASVTLLSALFTWLAVRLHRASASWPVAIILMMLSIGASSFHFLPRPHLATIALMAVVFSVLVDVECGRVNPRQLLLIPPLMIVWTNIHGGALGGLATVLLVLFSWLLLSNLAPSTIDRSSVARQKLGAAVLGTCASLSIIAILANPYGPKLPAVWLGLMTSDVLPRIIIEHAPMQLGSVESLMIFALAAIYVLLLARCWPSQRRITWLIPLVWLALAMSRIRHGPLFAVTAAIAIADMLPHVRSFVRGSLTASSIVEMGSHSPRAHRRFRKLLRRPALLPAGLIALALILQSAGIRFPLIGAGRCPPTESCWPVKSAAVLATQIEQGASPRVLNDMLFGGYLVYAVPKAKLYIDDRCELYGDQALLEYITKLCSDAGFVDAIAEYDDVNLALVIANGPVDKLLASSAHWTRLFSERSANLYQRRT